MRCHNGKGKALLYLRVAHESDRQYLDSGIAHLTRYAVEHCYSVVKVVQEVGPGVDGQRPDLSKIRADIRSGEPGYEVILVERLDRLTLIGGGDEFAQWAAPSVRIEVAGSSCRDADEAYQREVLEDLYYPLADALALRGVPPAKVESIISKGLDGIAEALGLLQGKRTR
jgi:predicted site-specific integrase-resolvase